MYFGGSLQNGGQSVYFCTWVTGCATALGLVGLLLQVGQLVHLARGLVALPLSVVSWFTTSRGLIGSLQKMGMLVYCCTLVDWFTTAQLRYNFCDFPYGCILSHAKSSHVIYCSLSLSCFTFFKSLICNSSSLDFFFTSSFCFHDENRATTGLGLLSARIIPDLCARSISILSSPASVISIP